MSDTDWSWGVGQRQGTPAGCKGMCGILPREEEMVREGGRWPEAELLCHMHAATIARGTIATMPSHTSDFHSEEMDNQF